MKEKNPDIVEARPIKIVSCACGEKVKIPCSVPDHVEFNKKIYKANCPKCNAEVTTQGGAANALLGNSCY